MQPIVLFNIFVLVGLVFFLVREEWRFRSIAARIAETKEDLTTIAHRLRSPLSNLRKYNEFLQSKEFGTLSFAQQEAIDRVQISLGESLVLLDRLLARSRLDEGKVSTQPALLDIREIVQGAMNAVQPAALSKKHTMTMSGNKKIKVFTDPLLLHGVLDEILANAVHYTPDKGKITITLTDTGKAAEVEIRDTGIGISAEETTHIFNKFYRGERAKPLFAGNGLGLSFARQFTAKLGGKISFTSQEGKGSTFTVSIPKKNGEKA